MNGHGRLLIFLLSVLALTSLLSPWFALGADWLAARWPEIERYPFSRIFNRTFMISAILMFFLCRRQLRIGTLSQLGVVGLRQGRSDMLMGWSLAFFSMVLLVGAMSLADIFEPFFRLPLGESLYRGTSAIASALTVSFFEEIFFRGILFKGLLETGGRLRAFVATNLFYSAVHFVEPGEPYFLDRFDPLAGFEHLLYTFTPFSQPLTLVPGLFGLFLIGVTLSYAFLRTGNLYLAMGLHAGWVFGLKTVRIFGDYRREDLGWLFGFLEPKIVSGAAAWIGILVVLALVHWFTRHRCGLAAGAPASREVLGTTGR